MLTLLLFCICAVFLLPLLLIYFHKWNRETGPVTGPNMTGKTVLITGSSAGIGKESARDLARRGARILMACRNLDKAQKVKDEIVASTGNNNIQVYQVELSNMESVRKCAQDILSNENRLDILINNAGRGSTDKYTLTPDGLELIMATNYYGHFLLTNLLLDLMKKSGYGRIINLSSSFHIFSPSFDPDDMNKEVKIMHNLRKYGQSKLCMMLFSVELARRLNGTGITANAIDPGFVRTEIFKKDATLSQFLFGRIITPISLTAEEGAETTIFLAVSDEVEGTSGRYFLERKIFVEFPMGRDIRLARKMWEASVRDVKLNMHQSFLQ